MGDFFKGWKRKSACGVLLAAVLLSLAWGSSDRFFFAVEYELAGWEYHLHSYCNEVTVTQHKINGGCGRSGKQYWINPDREKLLMWLEARRSVLSGEFERCGWSSRDPSELPSHYSQLVVPYWPGVLGLTCLAGILLLWTPRKNAGGRILAANLVVDRLNVPSIGSIFKMDDRSRPLPWLPENQVGGEQG